MDTLTSLTLPAPAKINLFLHINGRLENGYHELETLFTFLNHSDELHFALQDEDKIELTCQSADATLAQALNDLAPEQNLIVKAAILLKPHRKITQGVRIVLDKHLPMGGGVGGGSSNAATCLIALNTLWQCGLSQTQLKNLGQTLGADVPIFVHGHSALAQGIGEQLSDVTLPQRHYLVVHPKVHISTADIFTHPDLPRNTPKIQGDWQAAETKNDCEALVKKHHSEVEKALSWLLHYAPSRMTGTGACCFAEFDNKNAAEAALKQLPACWHGFVAHNVNVSPVYAELHRQLK